MLVLAYAITSPFVASRGQQSSLKDVSARYAGLCRVKTFPSSQSAELDLPLGPRYWGQALALRMAWTAITHAFLSSQIDCVIAGADLANAASIAVMRRLGMRFHKDVQDPPGVAPREHKPLAQKHRSFPAQIN